MVKLNPGSAEKAKPLIATTALAPSKSPVKIEKTIVTPGVAEAWLSQNAKNRKASIRFVQQYARDMAEGKWRLTGDAIRFSRDSTLIDGQHRLMACVKADAPFETFVIYDVDPDVRDVIDTGRSRSTRDMLALHGVANSGHVASALRLLINQKRGVPNSTPVTHTEILEAWEKHNRIGLYLPSNRTLPRGISVSLLGYMNYVGTVFLGKGAAATRMMTVLKEGVPSYKGDPIHKYRETIIRNYHERVGQMRGNDSALWTFKKCWNLFADNKPIDGNLVWSKRDEDIIGLDLDAL